MKHGEAVRRDRNANLAIVAAVICMIVAAVAGLGLLLPDNRSGDRSNPVYWMVILPLGVWAYGLTGFSDWALRLVRPALVVGPVVCVVVAGVAIANGRGVVLPGVALGLALMAGGLGLVLFGKSVFRSGN
jgi:hypothetical protein